jgi:hypothetical protein
MIPGISSLCLLGSIPDDVDNLIAAAADLRSIGYIVFNPAELFGGDVNALPPDMLTLLTVVGIQTCDAVTCIAGSESSPDVQFFLENEAMAGKPNYVLSEILR